MKRTARTALIAAAIVWAAARCDDGARTRARAPDGGVPAAPHAGHVEPPGEAAAPSAPRSREEPRAPIEVPAEQQARIGLEVAEASFIEGRRELRTVGIITADERRLVHVHTRIPGYVEEIHVDAAGDPVREGEPLYGLYSPELVATQREYLAARGHGPLSAQLARAALERLALWDVPESEIRRLRRTGKAQRRITFTSPASGFVIEKGILQGMYVTPEMELYLIADLSSVWIIVTLYEHELALVRPGDEATVALPAEPDRPIEGVISYIYPEVDLATRTAKARVEVDNPELLLRPGMYATVTIAKDLGELLAVPADAVIDTGVRRLVFVREGAQRFIPREIEIGPRVGDHVAVRSGLEPGEKVVVRASFLIDAESRLQAALRRGGAPTGHGEHTN